MKKILLALLLMAGYSVEAQISIVQNDMPYANDELYRTRANVNPFLNYQATGANHVWTFSNLTANVQDSATYQTVGSTNFVYALAYADIFFNPNRANHARPGVDIPFNNLLPIDNPYTFYYRSSTVYKKVGYGVELAGIPVPIIYTDHDEIYSLPINYGDTDSTTSAYNLSIPTLAYYGYEQSRVNEVDGWGVITTPAGTFDALRVKTTLYGRDTLNLDSLSIGFTIDRPVVREYKWLSNNFRVPIMQVNTSELFGIEIITDIFFYDELRTLNVVPPLATVLCPGSTVDIAYDKTGTFNAGGLFSPANIFRAQLSDATGSFAAPVNIGSVTSTQSGIISCTIPANTPLGNGYRIRVISTNPALTGNDNGFDITMGTVPVALATAGGVTSFCAGDSVLLSAGTDPAYSYQWQLDGVDITGAVAPDLNAMADGDYTVVVTNACGSSTSQAISVEVFELPEHLLTASSTVVCNGDPFTITGQDVSGQTPLTYQWYLDGNLLTGETAIDLTSANAGAYTLEVTNTTSGCIFTSAAIIIDADSIAVPVITAQTAVSFCDGESVVLETSSVSGATYQWQLDGNDITGADSSSYTASVGGDYTVVVTSLLGCTASSAIATTVVVNPIPVAPLVSASGNTTLCSGDSLLLSFTPDSTLTYQWQLDGNDITGATDPSYVASLPGAYTVVATSVAGCSSTSLPSDVIVNIPPVAPVVTTNGISTFCDGDSLLLETVIVPGLTYQWTNTGIAIPGANGGQYNATTSGTYNVIATDSAGCSAEGAPALPVTVNPLPAVPVITQSLDTLFASPASSYQWYLNGVAIPGATLSYYIVTVNGDYTVMVGDSNSCTSVSVVFPFNSVGISENSSVGVNIFPNPTSGMVIIESGELINGSLYAIHDMAGRIITSGILSGKTYVDLNNYSNGIYVLRISNDEVNITSRIIKQ